MLKIFIGFLVVILDLDIGGFDVAADFIGYTLIYLGLKEYLGVISFGKARTVTVIMLIKSLAYTVVSIFATEINIVFSIVTSVLNIPFAILFIYLLYLIVKGLRELELQRELDLNSTKMFKLHKVFAVIQVISSVYASALSVISVLFLDRLDTHNLTLNTLSLISGVTSVITAGLAIALLVVEIMLVICFYKAYAALNTAPLPVQAEEYTDPTEQ